MKIHQRPRVLCFTAFLLGLIWIASSESVNAQFTLEFTNSQVTNTPTFNDAQTYDFTIEIDEVFAPGVFSNPTLSSVVYNVSGVLSEPTPSGFPGFVLQRTIGGDEFYSQGSSLDFEIAADADLTDGLQIADLAGTGTVFTLNAREVDTGRYHPPLLELNSDGTGQLQNSNNFGDTAINPSSGEMVDVDFGEEYITDLTFEPTTLTISTATATVPEPSVAVWALMVCGGAVLRRRRV